MADSRNLKCPEATRVPSDHVAKTNALAFERYFALRAPRLRVLSVFEKLGRWCRSHIDYCDLKGLARVTGRDGQ